MKQQKRFTCGGQNNGKNKSMSDREADLERVKVAAQSLGEHFDSVQIFVTRHAAYEENGTIKVNYGEGNWFSRYGQIAEWMLCTDERIRKEVREEDK